MSYRKIPLLLLSAVGVALGLGLAAQDHEDEEAAAIAAAEAWLATVDAGDYEDSWDEAASAFQMAITKADWARALRGARGPLGALTSRTATRSSYQTSLPGAPDGEYVIIQFESSFANKASAVETVTPMRDEDGAWRVSGYFVK